MASDFVKVTLPTDNIVFHEGRGQYVVKCMTIPSDFSGVQFTSAVSGIVTGVHSWYQGELQWYVDEKGRLCSADGTFRLGRHGAIMKSKSSELLNYGDEFGNIVEGAALTDGSVIAKKLSDSSKLATTTCVFSSPDYNTVAWTSGVLVLADGTSFSIQAGNTGDMTGMTYIYFDRAVSQTQFQLAYDMTGIAYDGAILVCDAKQASSSDLLAHFVSINGYMLLNVNQLNVNYLSALSANIGTITTGLLQMGQATSFTAGAGVWVYGQGTASQFRIGNPATNKTISFDSATGNIVFGSAVSLTWSQIAAGGGKPADNATVGATWGTNLGSIPIRFAETPSGAGLYICSSYMGYYNGGAWTAYIDNSGLFASQNTSGGNTTILSSTGTYALAVGPTGSPSCTLTHAGVLTATGANITGIVSTASSGTRIVIDPSNQQVRFYNGATEVAQIYNSGTSFYLANMANMYLSANTISLYGTVQQTYTGYKFALCSGSTQTSLDADLLDGSHASAFSLTSHTHSSYNYSGPITMITVVDGIVTAVS